MRGYLLFALALSTMLIIFSSNVSALYEGDNPLLSSQYIAPRIDCDSTGQQCVLLAYNTNTNSVDVFITYDRFVTDTYPLTKNMTLVTDANIETLIRKNNASAIPYDVAFIDTNYGWQFSHVNTEFAITYGNKIYGINASSDYFGEVNTSAETEFSQDVWWFIDHNTDGSQPHFISINLSDGQAMYFHADGSEKTIIGNSSYPNWIPANYAGGILMATDQSTNDYNQSYILFSFDTINFGLSNTTESELAVPYDGIFGDNERFSTLKVFGRNSTDVFRYNLLGGTPSSYYDMSSNLIHSQSIWVNSGDTDDYFVVFQNSTGIYMFNNFQPTYAGTPNEYDTDLNTFVYGGLFRNPNKPKVACSADLSQCAMLVYDSGIFYTGVHLLHSIDPDHLVWTDKYTFSVNYDSYLINYADYQLPYDIAYNEDTGKYRIIMGIGSNLYEWDGITNPSIVKTYPTAGCSGVYYIECGYPLNFVDSNGDYFSLMGSYGYITYQADVRVLPWKGDMTSFVSAHTFKTGVSALATQISGIAKYEGVNLRYDIKAYVSGSYEAYDRMFMSDEFAYTNPPQYIYTDEKLVFFERDAGDLPNDYGHGIYYAGTSNWNDYILPTVTPYYIYDATSNEETFADSKFSSETGTKYYAIEIKKGTYPFYTLNNIYFYENPYYRTVVNAEYYDVVLDLYRSANITVNLSCGDYYAVSSGDLFEIYTPCNSYDLTYSTIEYRPYTSTESMSFLSGCDYNQVFIRLLKPYLYKIRIVDDITLQPISGATVNFAGTTKTTDSNGYANYTIYPLLNESIAITTDSDLCLYYLTASAQSIRSYPTIVSKSGYNSQNLILYPAEISGSTITYYTEKQINLLPEGTTLTVRLIDRNGDEIVNSDLSSVITASGADNIYVIDQITGDTLLQSSANGVPVQFYFGDDSTTFNVIINFSYVGEQQSVNLTMERDVPQVYYFRLNQTKTEMPCVTNLDCETNFCDSNYFYKLEGCISGFCSYKTPEFCDIGCDQVYGCYDKKTVTTCDTRYDCTSYCISDWKSATSVCGTDGYCIELNRICSLECPNETRGCSSTTGLCCEDEICYEDERERERFLLSYYYSSVDDILPELTYVNSVDYDYYCGVENRGERVCVRGATIPSQVTGTYRTSTTTVSTTPEDWQFTVDDSGNYKFFDLALECGSVCDIEVEYCPYGCDFETTYCLHEPLGDANITEKYDIDIYEPIAIIEGSINQTQIKQAGLGFLLLLVTPIFLVTLLALSLGGVVAWKTKEPIYASIMILTILTVFSLLGLFPIWLVIILIVIAGLVFSKSLVSLFQGGG